MLSTDSPSRGRVFLAAGQELVQLLAQGECGFCTEDEHFSRSRGEDNCRTAGPRKDTRSQALLCRFVTAYPGERMRGLPLTGFWEDILIQE